MELFGDKISFRLSAIIHAGTCNFQIQITRIQTNSKLPSFFQLSLYFYSLFCLFILCSYFLFICAQNCRHTNTSLNIHSDFSIWQEWTSLCPNMISSFRSYNEYCQYQQTIVMMTTETALCAISTIQQRNIPSHIYNSNYVRCVNMLLKSVSST